MVGCSRLTLASGAMACFASAILTACIDADPPAPRAGHVSGRILVTPGVGLAHAKVYVEQLHLYDGSAELLRPIGMTVTDENGYFDDVPTGQAAGLFRFRTSGGVFRDVVSDAPIELDSSTGLRALYRLGFFEQRKDLIVTPVHSLAEAQFRYLVEQGGDVPRALERTYQLIGDHFGALDWRSVVPADVDEPATSPIDEVRAAFVLGGLAVLADDLRAASDASPQAVNLFTLLSAATQDLEEGVFDGNDGNDNAPGSGLQIGACPAVRTCASPPAGCTLGVCRSLCDVYVNLFRGGLVGGIRKFIGHAERPSPLNRTGLSSLDAREMLERIGGNTNAELFGDSCIESADRVAPTIFWEALDDGAFVAGTITVRVRATDDAEAVPLASFEAQPDTDGDPGNNIAVAVIDTRIVNGGVDGALVVTAIARDLAGNERRATRTFEVDNTAPIVTVADSGFYVDEVTGERWTGQTAPTLHGTLVDAHAREVRILVGGEVVATATPLGTLWSAQIPEGKVTSGGRDVTVQGIDRAGNVTTTMRTLRLDATPPGVLVESSPVRDETQSSMLYDLDNPATNTWVQRHVTAGSPIDLAQSLPGACATVHKFSHLLYEDFVLGATGDLNPLKLSAVVSDDGVGIVPASSQVRVSVRHGANTTELIPWTSLSGTVIAPKATRYAVGLYRDGALPIPSLGTTEGEYHVELRAVDQLGRTTRQERCWTHRLLAPKLRPTPGLESGAPATGFARAMFSTSLDPGPGQFGDVAAKFLNPTASGAAVWIWRVRNYVGVPIYVTVNIPSVVNAHVYRQFAVRSGLTAYRSVSTVCGASPCTISSPSESYRSPANVPQLHQNIRFRARLFAMAGAEMGAELFPCSGCLNDDATQTYTFEVPARTTPQGAPLVEYAVLTYLRPTLPAGAGMDVLMALSDAANPDPDPAPYGEFVLNGQTLTGKLSGGLGVEACTMQEFDGERNQWMCIEKANRQRYRVLTSVIYAFLSGVDTLYRTGPTAALMIGAPVQGRLDTLNVWNTSEATASLP